MRGCWLALLVLSLCLVRNAKTDDSQWRASQYSANQLDQCYSYARDLANSGYGGSTKKADFTNLLVSCLSQHVVAHSPVKPAYALVYKADMLCERQEAKFVYLPGFYNQKRKVKFDGQEYNIALFTRGCINMQRHSRNQENWKFTHDTLTTCSYDASDYSVPCNDPDRLVVDWNGCRDNADCGVCEYYYPDREDGNPNDC